MTEFLDFTVNINKLVVFLVVTATATLIVIATVIVTVKKVIVTVIIILVRGCDVNTICNEVSRVVFKNE